MPGRKPQVSRMAAWGFGLRACRDSNPKPSGAILGFVEGGARGGKTGSDLRKQ